MIYIDNDIEIVKNSLVKQCIVGDIISFIVNIKNKGIKTIYDVSISDRLLPNLSFIKGSLKVDLEEFKNENIVSGISIGEIEAGTNKVVKFNAKVINSYSDRGRGSRSFCNYSYIDNENSDINSKCISSNKDDLEIFSPKLDITRESNKESVFIGENIKIKNVLKNNGDLELFNLNFKDNIPENTILVDDSFNINGINVNSIDIEKGIKIQFIKIGQIVTISYELKILDKNCKNKLLSKASVEYYCRLPIGLSKKLELKEASIDINIAISNFKQINLNGMYRINNIKPNILEINEVDCKVTIKNSSIVNTIKGISLEGQHSTGYKMIIIANLDTIMNYIADEEVSKIYSENYNSRFSSYIVLNSEFSVGKRVEIYPVVEKINFKLIDSRSFFYQISILLILKIQ